jgi:hypothetical protein
LYTLEEEFGLLFNGKTYIEIVREQGAEENLRNMKGRNSSTIEYFCSKEILLLG